MTAIWQQFEQAIAALLQALDPNARVTHDVEIPDMDTNSPRQRDVWIETSYGGHLAIKILVSCKRLARKLNQQDLDAFIGELRSSGAHKGVLYSRKGYTKPALEKARRLDISCCILLENQPQSIPNVLMFDAYCLRERVQLTVSGLPTGHVPDWTALLSAEGEIDGHPIPAGEGLAQLFSDKISSVRDGAPQRPPPIRSVALSLRPSDGLGPLILGVSSKWLAFRARKEAWLVNGSYSFTDSDFKGSFSTPSIDTWNTHPGPGWDEIEVVEMSFGNTAIFYFIVHDVRLHLNAVISGEV